MHDKVSYAGTHRCSMSPPLRTDAVVGGRDIAVARHAIWIAVGSRQTEPAGIEDQIVTGRFGLAAQPPAIFRAIAKQACLLKRGGSAKQGSLSLAILLESLHLLICHRDVHCLTV